MSKKEILGCFEEFQLRRLPLIAAVRAFKYKEIIRILYVWRRAVQVLYVCLTGMADSINFGADKLVSAGFR